jgi:hypothetical protein
MALLVSVMAVSSQGDNKSIKKAIKDFGDKL